MEGAIHQKSGRCQLLRSLRAATRSDQMMLDLMMLRFNLGNREDYVLFLSVHYSTLRALSPWWRDEDRPDFLALAYCLQNDLHELGFAAPPAEAVLSDSMTAHHCLGISYMIRGSRLGSVAMRHHVPVQFAATYLDFSPNLSWAQFLQQLEAHLSTLADSDHLYEVVSGAKLALARFSSILTRSLQ
jgi:heme oxygenase